MNKTAHPVCTAVSWKQSNTSSDGIEVEWLKDCCCLKLWYKISIAAGSYLILAAAKWSFHRLCKGTMYGLWWGYNMCRMDIIRLWIYNTCILCITNNSDCGFTKIRSWPLFIKSWFDFWPSAISVIDPWLSSWPRTKIKVQNVLECQPSASPLHNNRACIDPYQTTMLPH